MCITSCFAPSDKLYPYLLCHVTAHGYGNFKSYCQAKLLQAYGRQARKHAPCHLEWQAAGACAPMAIDVTMYDGVTKTVPLTSQMTAQEMGNMVVSTRGLLSCVGWTVAVQDSINEEHTFDCDVAVMDYIAGREANEEFKLRMAAHARAADAAGPAVAAASPIATRTDMTAVVGSPGAIERQGSNHSILNRPSRGVSDSPDKMDVVTSTDLTVMEKLDSMFAIAIGTRSCHHLLGVVFALYFLISPYTFSECLSLFHSIFCFISPYTCSETESSCKTIHFTGEADDDEAASFIARIQGAGGMPPPPPPPPPSPPPAGAPPPPPVPLALPVNPLAALKAQIAKNKASKAGGASEGAPAAGDEILIIVVITPSACLGAREDDFLLSP